MAATALNLFSQNGVADPSADLARNTVYLKLQLHAFGNSKKVNAARVNLGAADKKLFRISKTLLDSMTLVAIRSFDGKTRDIIYDRCLPFDTGVHFVPLTLIEAVESELRERRDMRQELIKQFLSEYPALCRDVSERLKEHYNAADYPTLDEVERSFGMSWQFISFGVPHQIEAIAPAIFAEERAKAAAELREAAGDIQQLMRSTLSELVAHLRDSLTPGADGKRKRFFDTTVTHLTDFLRYFDDRNVVRDSELKQIVDQARSMLHGVDVEALKNTDAVRQKIQRDMSDIATRLAPMVTRVPSRAIRLVAQD